MSKLLRCCATYLKGARLPHETRTCRQPRFSLVAPRPGIRVNPQRRFACRGGVYTNGDTGTGHRIKADRSGWTAREDDIPVRMAEEVVQRVEGFVQ